MWLVFHVIYFYEIHQPLLARIHLLARVLFTLGQTQIRARTLQAQIRRHSKGLYSVSAGDGGASIGRRV